MAKIYHVNLSDEERASLLHLIKSGEHSARKITRARILLLADEGKMDQEIATTLHSSVPTVQRTRERFVKEGLDNALNEKPRLGGRKAKKLDEKGEALLVTLARSEPPAGRKRWTLQLLADRLVELRVVESISDETVRQVCKKGDQALGKETLVSPDRWRRVRLAHGGCAGPVCQGAQPQAALDLLRREDGPVDRRDPLSLADGTGQAGAV